MELNRARQLSLDLVAPKGVEWVRLEDALGRVLAETLQSERDVPGESRSRLDGFAIRSSDSCNAAPDNPAVLKVRPGLIAAGHMPEQLMEAGRCIRILTGAPIPKDADAVVPQEDASLDGDRLILARAYFRGSGLTFKGEDFQRGELLVSKGELLNPTRLALVAALGYSRIPVFRQPVVALLATGDEIRELGETAEGPWTFCNNRHLLAWLTSLQGARPLHLGIARDNPEAIAERIHSVEADFVITTGGMGRGDRDYILEAWQLLGTQMLFRQVNVSPGKNSALGIRGSQIFFGLSGNPWGAQLIFQELAVPALWRHQGLEAARVPLIPATLESSLSNNKGGYRAVRGILEMREESAAFIPFTGKAGSLPAMMRKSFAYIILEPHVIKISAGSKVQVRLHDFPILASPLI